MNRICLWILAPDIGSGYVTEVTKYNAVFHPNNGSHAPMHLMKSWLKLSQLAAVPILVGRVEAQAHLIPPHALGVRSFKALVSPWAALMPSTAKFDISNDRDKQASSLHKFTLQEGRIVHKRIFLVNLTWIAIMKWLYHPSQ